MRTIILVLSVLMLSACAAAPSRGTAVLTVANEAADELECVGKCLEFGDESCETCVDKCMDAPPSAAVAIMRGAPLSIPTAR